MALFRGARMVLCWEGELSRWEMGSMSRVRLAKMFILGVWGRRSEIERPEEEVIVVVGGDIWGCLLNGIWR